MGANANSVHRIPLRARRLPEWDAIDRIAVGGVAERTRVVDENIESSLLAAHQVEQLCNLPVVAMVAAHWNASSAISRDCVRCLDNRAGPRDISAGGRPARYIDDCPGAPELECDPLADTSTGT